MGESKKEDNTLFELSKFLVVRRKEKWPNEPLNFLVKKSGLSIGTLNRFERGEILTPPTDSVLNKLCEAYEIDKERARGIIYPVEEEKGKRGIEDDFVRVPILTIPMFLEFMVNRSRVPEDSNSSWILLPKSEDYHCATQLSTDEFEPTLSNGDTIVVRQCDEVKTGDILVLATEDFKGIDLKIFSEDELQIRYLRSLSPLKGQKDVEYNVDVKKRLLGKVELIQRKYG